MSSAIRFERVCISPVTVYLHASMRSDANDFAAEEKLSSEERIDRPGEMEEQMHSVSAYYPFIGQIRGLIKDALVPRWRNLSSHFRKQRKQERTSCLSRPDRVPPRSVSVLYSIVAGSLVSLFRPLSAFKGGRKSGGDRRRTAASVPVMQKVGPVRASLRCLVSWPVQLP